MVYWLGIVSLVFFYVAIIGVGFWAARKSRKTAVDGKKSEDLMVAGRDIGLVVGIFTMTATWVGGGYINGTAEVVSDPAQGLIWCQAPIGYALSLAIGGIFFAGKMRKQGYVTMLDPFQKKYGERMGGLLFIPALMGEIFWSAAILSALGATINVIFGVGDMVSIIVSAVIAVLYTMFGGLYAVAYTDVIQLFCIFVGLWLAVPFALLNENVPSLTNSSSVWLGQAIPTSSLCLYIDSGLMLIFGGIPWQVYFQRVLSSKTARRAQILSFTASIGCLVMAVPAVLIGAVGATTNWNATGYQGLVNDTFISRERRKILPIVLRWLCPEFVGIVGLGAVSAAVMSSADSSILSAASMFARNIFKSIIWQKATDMQIIWTMRIAVFVIGALACFLGIIITSIYDLWFLCSDLVFVIIFPQLICVVYLNRSNTYGSLAGYIIGFLFRILIGEPLFKLPSSFPDSMTEVVPMKTFCMFLSLITIIVVSFLLDYLFKSEKLKKEWDVFKCIVNIPLTASDVDDGAGTFDAIDTNEEQVIPKILAKRMSFKSNTAPQSPSNNDKNAKDGANQSSDKMDEGIDVDGLSSENCSPTKQQILKTSF